MTTDRDLDADGAPDLAVRAIAEIERQLAEAGGAPKCHACGCLHQTVAALADTEPGRSSLAEALAQARETFTAKKYDCLGCQVCFPAIAANLFSEAFPGAGRELDLCPTDTPAERSGWPPLPGDFKVVRYRAPVAVCTLNSGELAGRLAVAAPEGLAIAGTMQTENLGIERLIQNVLANPHIRFLVLCGEDTRQAVGHLPGQSLAALFQHGLDSSGRIQGAPGRRPVLRNVPASLVQAFLDQVELIPLIGEDREDVLLDTVRECAARNPGPAAAPPGITTVGTVVASEPDRLVRDPAGFLVVFPDSSRHRLVVEHYTNAGVLDFAIEGPTPAALTGEIIARGLITRLDHAAYLGRELARAERSLRTGEPYVQDRAPGDLAGGDACGCTEGTACQA